jgi:mono/diheme cytochrome c family protein
MALLGALPLALLLAIVAWQWVAGWRSQARWQEAETDGRALFALYCAPCHGGHMQGRPLIGQVGAPPLNKRGFRVFFGLLPDAMEGWVADQIAQGNPIMPAFGKTLTPAQRREVALYIRLVNMGDAPPP